MGAYVNLRTVGCVNEFVNISTKYDIEVSLVSGRYIVNAKSLMGIFSLDLTKPVELKIEDGSVEEVKKYMEEIEYLLVK